MAHALLSPSGSKKWLKCTMSVRTEEGFPDSGSDAAKEGTLAHELAEVMIQQALKQIAPKQAKARIAEIKKSEFYEDEMLRYISDYRDFCLEQLNEVRAEDPTAELHTERTYDISRWAPECFGTGDITIVSNTVLKFIDLKYGKGVPVFAHENTQLMIYSLGAYEEFGYEWDFDSVDMYIYQPRISGGLSGAGLTPYTMSTRELLKWGKTVLRPQAELAFNGEGEYYVSEDTCKFCKAKPRCQALANHCLELTKYEFKTGKLLPDEGVVEALKKGPLVVDWFNAVQKYALDQAVKEGKKWDDFKIVEGRSNRKYVDETAVAELVISEGFEETQVYNKKIIGIGDMEKLLGVNKTSELLKDLILKPKGAPTLVPESDKRDLYNSVKNDF